MRSRGIVGALLVGIWMMGVVVAAAHEVTILDDCDPDDPTWAPTGGCSLVGGDVDRDEFNAERISPLSMAVIGHQAWRNEPSYLKIESSNGVVQVKNKGGRTHTFTEVVDFGGGRIPGLITFGLMPAPECAAASDLLPGESIKITGLSVGNHRFQCCIHPWMRALIKVLQDD